MCKGDYVVRSAIALINALRRFGRTKRNGATADTLSGDDVASNDAVTISFDGIQ